MNINKIFPRTKNENDKRTAKLNIRLTEKAKKDFIARCHFHGITYSDFLNSVVNFLAYREKTLTFPTIDNVLKESFLFIPRKKSDVIHVRIGSKEKIEFYNRCNSRNLDPSNVIRELIATFMESTDQRKSDVPFDVVMYIFFGYCKKNKLNPFDEFNKYVSSLVLPVVTHKKST